MEGSNQLLDMLSNKIRHLEIEDPTLNKEQKLKWNTLLEEKKREFLKQLEGLSETDKFEYCKKIAMDEVEKKTKALKDNSIHYLHCNNYLKKKDNLARDFSQLKVVNTKLEELCRDFSSKNKSFDTENKSLPIEEEAKRVEFLKKFNESISEMEREVSDEKIALAADLNAQLKNRVGLLLEDDKSLDREYNEFMANNQRGTEEKQANFQKTINETISSALEEASHGKEEWQRRSLSIQQMRVQMEELKKNTIQINDSVSKSEEIIVKYEEEIGKKVVAIKQLEDDMGPFKEKKKQFDLELLLDFEKSKEVQMEIEVLKEECGKLQKQKLKNNKL